MNFHYNGSRLIFGEWGNRTFLDTMNLSNPPLSIEKMGAQIGLPKLAAPPFDGKISPEFIAYCRRDAEITFRWLEFASQRLQSIGARLRMTLPAVALDLFERKFYRRHLPKFTPHRDFLFRAYAGGRTEIFRLGPVPGPIQYCDVQSMYPSVMRAERYPDPRTGYKAAEFDPAAEGVAEVTLRLPDCRIPPLWHRTKSKTIFPVGTLRGVWTMPEIRAALEIGGEMLAFHGGVCFRETETPFVEFVDALWALKQSGGDNRSFAKYLLNSLYGKFAERGGGYSIGPGGSRNASRAATVANVIWSVYVTAYARLKLWRALVETELRGGEALYCDTDSVVYCAPEPIWDGNGLGELTHEGTHPIFEAKLPKLYRLGDIYHAKGVPHSHAREYFEAGRAEWSKPVRMREALRAKPPKPVNAWLPASKAIRSRYDKREILPGGGTRPWRIAEPTAAIAVATGLEAIRHAPR